MGSIRERVDKDGKTRFVALYRDLRGRQRSAGTFPTAKQADKAWQRAEALVESGKLGDLRRGRQTFAHYVLERWLPAHQIEASTRERYTYMISKHLLPQFGAMRMIDVLPEHVRDWIRSQRDSGLSAATVAGNKTILSAIFTTALNDQVVFLHPCAGVKTPTVARKPRMIVSPAQYDAIHHALPGPVSQLMVETAIESGLRWGELTELRTHDLDTGTRMLTVARAVTETTAPTDGDRFAVKDYPKDKEYRRLNLSPALCAAFAEHIHERLRPGGLLFPFSLLETDGGPPSTDSSKTEPPIEETEQPSGRSAPNNQGRTYPHGTLTAYTMGKCRCPHCRSAFASYRAQRRATGKDNPRGTRIVHTDLAGHLPRNWFRHHIWVPATTGAGLPHAVRFHDLRHAHASWLLAGGADIQNRQRTPRPRQPAHHREISAHPPRRRQHRPRRTPPHPNPHMKPAVTPHGCMSPVAAGHRSPVADYAHKGTRPRRGHWACNRRDHRVAILPCAANRGIRRGGIRSAGSAEGRSHHPG